MKKLLLLLLPFAAAAQTDSLSYTTDTVAAFERTTLVDEFNRAFGQRKVWGTLRAEFNYGKLNAWYSPSQISYEQKVANSASVKIGISDIIPRLGSLTTFLYGNSPTLNLEARYYYQMAKKVRDGKQQPNTTGDYFGFFGSYSLGKGQPNGSLVSNFYNWKLYIGAPIRIEKGIIGIAWGRQLGKFINYGVRTGYSFGANQFIVNQNLDNYEVPNRYPFLASFALISLGIDVPLKTKANSNSCEFRQCNVTVPAMWKFNINNLLLITPHTQQLSLDIAREWRMNTLPVSLLLNVQARYLHNKVLNGKLDVEEYKTIRGVLTTVYNYEQVKGYFDEVKIENDLIAEARSYPIQFIQLRKGKTGRNLNGVYLGLRGIFQGVIFDNERLKFSEFNHVNGGALLGYQLQTNRNSFIDFNLYIGKTLNTNYLETV